MTVTIPRVYGFGVLLLIAAVIVFYYLQNQPNRIGGGISFPKACWLGLALFYWYFLPPLLIADKRSNNHRFYIGLKIFFASMLLRAVAELYLLYGTQAWYYHYGIVHNMLSLVILTVLSISVRNNIETPLKITLYLMLLMFIGETYFASYMMLMVKDGYQNSIWFIDNAAEHRVNNGITTALVLLLTLWLLIFYFQWITTWRKNEKKANNTSH